MTKRDEAAYLFMLVILAGGCAGKGKSILVAPPTARVASLAITEQTDQGISFALTVDLTNPNQVALPLVGVRYSVRIDGVGWAAFEDHPHRTLPAGGRQTVSLTGALAVADEVPAQAGYTVQGAVTYEPPGEVRKLLTQAHLPLPATSFQGKGQLP